MPSYLQAASAHLQIVCNGAEELWDPESPLCIMSMQQSEDQRMQVGGAFTPSGEVGSAYDCAPLAALHFCHQAAADLCLMRELLHHHQRPWLLSAHAEQSSSFGTKLIFAASKLTRGPCKKWAHHCLLCCR